MATYKIVSGDTLWKIAQANKTTIQDLQKANPSITDPNKIFAGQVLNLPTSQPPQSPTTPPAQPSTPPTTPPVQPPQRGTQPPQGTTFYNQSQLQQMGKMQDPVTGQLFDAPQTLKDAWASSSKITPPTSDIPTTGTTPNLPPGSTTAGDFITSVSGQLEKDRAALKEAYDAQIKDAQNKLNAAQAKVDEYNKNQLDILGKTKELQSPFQAEYEKSQEELLYVKKNFEENQKLTDELNSLLTQGNELIKQQQGVTGLASIRDPRINQTMSDISARAGVIQAVMSARNNQISVAYTMIDRAVAATNADRQSQLNYYQSLSSYYSGLSAIEQNKITTLTSDQKKTIENKIDMLKSSLDSSQKTADALKAAMINPQTALTYAKAGITLNDSVETINKKLADYAYTEDVRTTANNMAANGFQAITSEEAKKKDPKEIITLTDSRGNKQQYWKQVSKYSLTKDAAGNLIQLNTQTGEWKMVGQSGASTTGGMTPSSQDYSYGDFVKTLPSQGQVEFNKMNDLQKSNVMSLIRGDIDIPTLMQSRGVSGSNARQKLLQEVKRVDPTYSDNRYKVVQQWNNPNGKEFMTRSSINTAMSHMAITYKSALSLGNTKIPKWNDLANWFSKNTGNPELTSFVYDLTALSGEIASAYKNGTAPTDQETEKFYNALSGSMSPEQFKGTFTQSTKLMAGKLKSLAQEFKQSAGRYPTDPIIQPSVLNELKEVGIDTTSIDNLLKEQGYVSSTPTSGNDFSSMPSDVMMSSLDDLMK